MFWNLYNKNLVQEVIDITKEKKLEVLMFAESKNLDTDYLLEKLNEKGKRFEIKKVCPKKEDIIVVVSKKLKVIVFQEEWRYSVYKITEGLQDYLLFVVHLSSPMYSDEKKRNWQASVLSQDFRKLEEECNEERRKQKLPLYDTIIAGDFNLHPFSDGIISMYGFNAVLDINKAKKGIRSCDGEKIKFYYNPMWKLMGKNDLTLGTYYSDTDNGGCSFYWYTFDQVLIRPELIDRFVWEEFEIR